MSKVDSIAADQLKIKTVLLASCQSVGIGIGPAGSLVDSAGGAIDNDHEYTTNKGDGTAAGGASSESTSGLSQNHMTNRHRLLYSMFGTNAAGVQGVLRVSYLTLLLDTIHCIYLCNPNPSHTYRKS